MSRPSPRALFIVPPTGRFIRESRCQTPIDELKTISLRPPIDLLYAAASFERGGAECRLTDYPAENLAWDDLRREIAEFKPAYLILEITTPSLEDDLAAADLAKKILPAIVTIAKGAHFNVFDRETLEARPALDMVLRGEYEPACEELAGGLPVENILGVTWRASGGEIRRNPDRAFADNLDAFPFPARHLLKNDLYLRPDTGQPQTTIVTNRGCPFSCVFCLANQVAGHKNRYRSVANVMAELRECVERHNIRSFLFRSDLFTQRREWVIEFCKAILDSGLKIDWASNSRVDCVDPELLDWMKRAGCWIIAFGVESGVNEHLRLMNKRADTDKALEAIRMARRAGILSSVYLLMGLPWDTADSMRQNIRFFKRLDADFFEIFYIYPFPGTPLYNMAVEKGLLKPGSIPRDAYSAPAMPTEALTIEELSRWRKRALRSFYFRPRYLLRTLARAAREGNLLRYMKYGLMEILGILLPQKRKG
ncbi:MAG: radical SAM protein [Candidatus Sumerlaeota bacterium]|nr:radical SAM protein [Candidatus Sumerlaeota bacterium]